MLKQIALENLADVAQGTVGIRFQNLIELAVKDCLNRPGVDKSREVIVKVRFKPRKDEDGLAEEADVDVVLASKIPDFASQSVNCSLRKTGHAVWNDLSEGDVDQLTIDQS